MSGRIHLSTTPGRIAEILGVLTLAHELRAWPPRYNIVPGQPTLIVRAIEGVSAKPPISASTRGKPLAGLPVEIASARWGLVPRWAGEPDIGVRATTTRGEDAHERPALAELVSRRRCLVPVDGLYEWTPDRRPVWFGYQDQQTDPFDRSPRPVGSTASAAKTGGGGGVAMLAGLWDQWEAPGTPDDVPAQARATLDSFTLLTAPGVDVAGAQPLAGFPLERIPVVLEPAHYAAWLDPESEQAEIRTLAAYATRRTIVCYEVGPWVNSPRHDSPRCIEPLSALGEGLVTGLFGSW